MARTQETRRRMIARRIEWMRSASMALSDALEYYREHDTGDCLENDIAKARAIDRIDAAYTLWLSHVESLDALMLEDRARTPQDA